MQVQNAKQETKNVEEKLKQEKLNVKQEQKNCKKHAMHIQQLLEQIEQLNQTLLQKEHTIVHNTIKAEQEKEIFKTKEKNLKITIKVLRDRLHVYQSEAEEKACLQRQLSMTQINQMENTIKEAHIDLLHRQNQLLERKKIHDTESSALHNEIERLHSIVHTVTASRDQAEYREKLALREMKDTEARTESMKKKLGWLMQRFRVSEMRRIELEKRFGTMSAPR